jgi:CRISPR type III-B/RAMP module-associated protein Cmr5
VTAKRVDIGLAGHAAAALDTIRHDSRGTVPPEVISQLKGLPAMLRTSGLPATMAFLYARSGSNRPVERAYRTVRDALLTELAAAWSWTDQPDAVEFFRRITGTDQLDLALAGTRLEEFAIWLRRLAEALERSVPSPPGTTGPQRPHQGEGDGRA